MIKMFEFYVAHETELDEKNDLIEWIMYSNRVA